MEELRSIKKRVRKKAREKINILLNVPLFYHIFTNSGVFMCFRHFGMVFTKILALRASSGQYLKVAVKFF